MHFGIYDGNGGQLVGTVTLPVIDRNHQFADISFVVGHPLARGKGYATEAVHGVIFYAFHVDSLQKLWAGYYGDHRASEKVLKKNGFVIIPDLIKGKMSS